MEPDHKQEIRAAQVRLLYEQLPSALLATIVNAAILVAVMWVEVDRSRLMGWFLMIVALVVIRQGHRRIYLRSATAQSKALVWGRQYLYGVAANGALWGAAGFLFFTTSYIHQVFLAFVLMGMVSGSISTLSSWRGAYQIFVGLALLPYGLRLLGVGDAMHMAMAGMLVVYVIMMSIIGERLHATVTESLRLRYELKKANAELELRVEERTAELKQSEEALRLADTRKDEFIAMLGHELRNPLAPIRNALQVLNKSGASESRAKWAHEIIDRQTSRLTRLVDDLLDVSRVMYGKIGLQETTLDVCAVVKHVVEESMPLIQGRGQDLSVHLPEEPIWINGDLVRVDQIISNLLHNASKYSDASGRIRLEVDAIEQWVRLRVQDNGIGIAPELLPHVFDPFIQANHTLARTQGGLGIGLTLVKRLVEMHGGSVEARSEGHGRGSEFVVRLPRHAAPEAAEPAAAHGSPAKAEPSARIMVVDDNHDAVEALSVLLGLEGYNVAVAYDGISALSDAVNFRPDVMLLDVGMPDMDGYQVARELRAREATKSMIIIALTGYGQPDDRALAAAAGFTDHLTKPIDADKLYAVLKAHLHDRK